MITGLHHQDAYIFIPQDKDIVKLAETIQIERDHALDEAERQKGAGAGIQGDFFGSDYTPALKGKFIPLGSEATDSKTITVNLEINNGARHAIDTRRVVTNQDPVYLQKERLMSNLNLLAKSIAKKRTNGNRSIKPDWKIAHKLWREHGGKEMRLETIEELNKRLNFYQNLLRN